MIETADRWTRQPQRPLPVAAAWRSRAQALMSGVDVTRNAAKRGMLGDATISGTVGRAFGQAGQAATFAASAHAPLDAANFLFGTQRDFAMLAVVRRASAQLYRFAIRAASSTTYDLTAGIGCEFSGSGKMVFSLGLKNYDEFEIAETTQLVDGEIGAYVGTWNATTLDAKLFKNGALQNTLHYTSASNSPRSIPLSVGNDPTSTAGRNWNGEVYLAAFFDGLVSDAEAVALTRNPWQLFSRRPHRVYMSGAASLMQQLMLNSSGMFEYGTPGASSLVFLNTSGAIRAGATAGSGDQAMSVTSGDFTAAV